jgi:hypothetical protein
LSIFAPAFAFKVARRDLRFFKIFLKKVHQKFGGFKNMIYLCTRFSPFNEKGSEAIRKWFFDLLVLYIERKV